MVCFVLRPLHRMPFDYPPGQVLSSVPSSSDKRRSSKLGGCAGVLFQIFHGKRLFPRKSLPAERPKQAASNYTDDKLPIAKLLLIADENSGPLESANEEVEVENVPKVEPDEEKALRRTPGVVARLMGLDTMPSPESMSDQRKQFNERKNMDDQFPADAPQQGRPTSAAASVQPYPLLHRAKTRDFKTDLPAKFAARQRKRVPDGVTKSKALAKNPSLSPYRFDASFPSSAKGESLGKNSVRPQKSADLREVAPKMLEAANPQPNCQNRSERLQSSVSRNRTGLFHTKSQLTKSVVQVPGRRQDDVNAMQVATRYTNTEMMSRRQIADVQKPQLAEQHKLNSSSKCPPRETTLVKRNHSAQGASGQPKVDNTRKLKPDWRRQEETSRRLSQPTVCSTVRSQRVGQLRHPSPPKSFQDSSGGACSSQASNCVFSSSEGTMASRLIKSHVGSNNVSLGRVSSSSVKGSREKPEDVDDYEDTKQPLGSIYDKRADLPRGNTTILKNSDASYAVEYSQFSQDESNSSAIYTESLQRSSLESSISSDPSLSEFTTSSEECTSFPLGENINEEKWKDDHNKLDGIKRASDLFLSESSSESLFESLTMSSAGDTATSHIQSDANTRSVDSAHPYSGRNTAAILQELLTALSSSTSERKSTFNKKDEEGTESCFLKSELRQVEEAQILQAGYVPHTEDFCMESIFQDCASSDSLDSSQLSQGIAECEMGNAITSKDCASNAELQAEGKYLPPEIPARGRSDMQHGLSRDCEALMSTLSKLHHIDPEVIGLKVRTEKLSCEEVVASGDGLFGCLLDTSLLDKPEEQSQWGFSSSTSLLADDDADSIYRSDIESSFTNAYDEAATWNKKLVTDCLNEALKSLSKQIYKFSSSLSEQSSATHVLSRVYKQLEEWRGMATSMNLDDMVEKEMNLTTRSWRNIGIETEEVAEVVESTIFSGLLEEVLLELI